MFKMKNAIFFLFCLITSMTSGCSIEGSGITKSETREVPVFSGIELRSTANVYIVQGEKQDVRIEADDNLLQHIQTKVKDDALVISSDDKRFNSKSPINIYVTVKDLCMIDLSGSGNVITRNEINCQHMTIRLSGSGDIRAMLSGKSLKATLTGSGNLDLSGSTAETDFRLSGSGNINAGKLQTFSTNVLISGSGTSTVDVKNELTVNITGSGNVYYVEAPDKIRSRITGSGAIQKEA